jgi:hypothetical protein
MSVEQTPVVDAIGIDRASGAVHLTITDHLQWDQAHLFALQNKINSYLGFIESGEIFVSYPQARDRDIKIDVVMKFRPTEDAFAFLQQAETVIEKAGILFGYGPGASGYADDNG